MSPVRVSLVSALLVAAGLGGCFRGSSGGGGPTPVQTPAARAAALVGDPLAFIPADSELVFGIDAQQVLQSPLWRHVEASVMQSIGAGLAEFQRECGYDVLRALRGVTIAFRVEAPDVTTGVMVLRGVDRDKTTACVRRAAPLQEDVTVAIDGAHITMADEELGMVATFVDASTVVIRLSPQPDRAGLDAAIAAGAPLRKSPAFFAMWSRLDPKQAMWALINGASKAFDNANLEQRPSAMYGTVGLANGLAATVRIRVDTTEKASAFAAKAQAVADMARAYVEKLDVTTEDNELVTSVSLTMPQIVHMLQLAGAFIPWAAGIGGPPQPAPPAGVGP